MDNTDSLLHKIFDNPVRNGRDARPLYLQLQQRIRDAIRSGLLHDGDALPPEREIASTVNVSRVTVRRAIDDLVTEGLLIQRQGVGTFVSDRVEQPLNFLKSFSEVMRERGRQPGSKWLDRSLGLASEEEQRALRLGPDDEVVRFHRLRLVDDQPMGLELAAVPRRFLDNPFLVQESLYQVMADKGLRPVKALQRLRAISIDEQRAHYLAIPANSAVLYIERLGLLEDDTPVEFTRSWFPGDAYDFVAEIRNTNGDGLPVHTQ